MNLAVLCIFVNIFVNILHILKFFDIIESEKYGAAAAPSAPLITHGKDLIFMDRFKKISPREIAENPFSLIGDDWGLVTAGGRDSFNTMTVSWGGVGILWGKPVVYAFIRPQRYTYGFLEREERFSLSFYPEEYRKALALCGSKSGRDVDKVAATGLIPAFTEDNVPYFEQAKLVLICKKLYAQDLNEQSVIDSEAVLPNYKGDDWHRMYVGEITSVLRV